MSTKLNLIASLSAAAISLTLAACQNTPRSSFTPSNAPSNAPAVASRAITVSSGTFSGRSKHVTTGRVALERTAAGYQLNFGSDFSLDGAPDPIVAVGNRETYLSSNKISGLRNKTGQQVYPLPAKFTPANFSEVYVWCEKFSIPLGVARLSN